MTASILVPLLGLVSVRRLWSIVLGALGSLFDSIPMELANEGRGPSQRCSRLEPEVDSDDNGPRESEQRNGGTRDVGTPPGGSHSGLADSGNEVCHDTPKPPTKPERQQDLYSCHVSDLAVIQSNGFTITGPLNLGFSIRAIIRDAEEFAQVVGRREGEPTGSSRSGRCWAQRPPPSLSITLANAGQASFLMLRSLAHRLCCRDNRLTDEISRNKVLDSRTCRRISRNQKHGAGKSSRLSSAPAKNRPDRHSTAHERPKPDRLSDHGTGCWSGSGR